MLFGKIKPKRSDTERARRLHMLIKARADTPAVAQFVLGRSRRASNAPTRQAFPSALEGVLTPRFLPLLKRHGGSVAGLTTALDLRSAPLGKPHPRDKTNILQ